MIQNRRKIILDCDPGHDDAIAIILAGKSKAIDLLGITVSAGNQTIHKTGFNALNVCESFNIDVPVVLGASKPLKKELEICDSIHGESGLDGFDFLDVKKEFYPGSAANFIYEEAKKHGKITLVCTGPLTNIAQTLIDFPEIKKYIEEIVLMGGSIGAGNVTPAAEFNIFVDPEAADIVFNSGLIVKMCGLDVTRKVLVLPEILERARQFNSKTAKQFVSLMEVFNKNQKEVFGLEGAPLHDPVTLVSLIDPTAVEYKFVNVEIDLSGGCSYGRTNCDIPNYLKKKPNAFVAIDINVEKYWNIVMKVISEE